MLRKLRLKFIALSMSLVTIVLAAVFVAGIFSARDNLEHISREVLWKAIKEPPGQVSGKNAALPYFTMEIWNGKPARLGGIYPDLTYAELSEIAAACMESPDDEGRLPQYGLRYLRKDNGLFMRVAFVDMSMEVETLRQTVKSQFMIALLALLPLLGVSALLSHWAVSPVEKAWKQQRQFLSDASHELKTPLTVILSNAELLEASSLAERQRRWTENIRAESGRMKTLVEEMLTLARADDASPSAAYGEVSLSDIALDCALSFEPVAFETGKPLLYEIAPDLRVTGDAEKLRRLVSVLLDNALKYGADGGAVSLTLEKSDRQAKLTVSNPGTPIPPQTLSHIFERFYRGDASRGESSGFGLGLSIADAIAKEHKATLRAESDERSTRFYVSLALLRTDTKRVSKKARAGADKQSQANAETSDVPETETNDASEKAQADAKIALSDSEKEPGEKPDS
ncbi:MAG: HAMP domain-containing histidine kinase [Oscillospiraceae bacterium]|nr:HAMP domain-containing histidine kinase [Oscillospiraceae bacterium]